MANYDSSHTGATIDSAVSQITDASTDLNVDSNSLVVDKSANNVGIGVTAPGGIANGLSLVPDLEIRGAAGSGAACAGVLALTTAETSTVDGDVQGAIVFQSPVDGSGTDAILSGAAIWAEADATFSSSVNNTELVFATNTSAAATERMRIEAGGTVSITGDLTATGNIDCDGFDGNAGQLTAKAWVNFNGTGTVAIRDSYNVSSITDNGTGDYTVNFTNSMADTNYLSIGMAGQSSTSQQVVSQQAAFVGPATDSCRYQTTYENTSAEDTAYVGIAILGDLA